jgi:hypothetical protein
MKIIDDAWKESKDWKVEKPGYKQNEVIFRVVPVVGNIYPIESDVEIGKSFTQDPDYEPYAMVGVYAGIKKYSDCGKDGVGPVFIVYNYGMREIERYFAKNLEFFKKDCPALYVNECNLQMSSEERREAMELLRNADLLPNDVRMHLERIDIPRNLNAAIEAKRVGGNFDPHGFYSANALREVFRDSFLDRASQRAGDISRCDLGMEVA